MRNPKRIDIVSKYLFKTPILYRFLGLKGAVQDNLFIYKIIAHKDEIIKKWKEYPDYRFGQLLSNLRYIETLELENRIWNIEEDLWLVEKGYCNIEDISFWGINFFKNNKPRKKVKYVLLKDLKTDHIKNIIKWFKENNSLHKLNRRYLEYFNKRING